MNPSDLSYSPTAARTTAPFARDASEVTLVQNESGTWKLIRNGVPYYIRGAGGVDHLELFQSSGGNTMRTWGMDQLTTGVPGESLLDQCAGLGLNVMVGLWLKHARHGADYGDKEFLQHQRDRIRAAVRTYRDHSAVLMWGLGNEMEGDGSDPRIWQELEVLAQIVKEEDPHHPVCTVIAGTANDKVRRMMEHYSSLDLLGVNIYAGAEKVDQNLTEQGWDRPYLITEFGPIGHWEVETTTWGAPIEPISAAKAASYETAHRSQFEQGRGLCLGTFCFLWGHKQETTSTWFGMFLKTGEKTPMVDAMHRIWSGKEPEQCSPKITALTSTLQEQSVPPGSIYEAKVECRHPNQSVLEFEWQVVAETNDRRSGGDQETTPPVIPDCILENNGTHARIQTPHKSGGYRVFIFVRDGQGGGSGANFPFFVA